MSDNLFIMDGLDAAIAEAVQSCRASDCRNFAALAQLDGLVIWGCLRNRLHIERAGVINLAFDYLRIPGSRDWRVRQCLWGFLQSFVIVDDLDDHAELVPIDSFARRGGIELGVKELDDPHCHFRSIVLSALSWSSMQPQLIPRILGTGVHKYAVAQIVARNWDLADLCMALLRGLSGLLSEPTRRVLSADGALECMLPFLQDLHAHEDDMHLRRGFRAASMVARLTDVRDCASVVRDNPQVIEAIVYLLDRVLDAGPKGIFINMAINPHLITMDILRIAAAHGLDRSMLKDSIPVLVRALEMRGESNQLLAVDIVNTFALLAQNQDCQRALGVFVPRLRDIFATIRRTAHFSEDMNRTIHGLLSFVPTLVDASSDNSECVEEETIVTSKVPRSRVVVRLSYHWRHSDLVMRVDELLREQGVDVRVDYRSQALEKCEEDAANSAALVFMSQSYEQSVACRQEYDEIVHSGVYVHFLIRTEAHAWALTTAHRPVHTLLCCAPERGTPPTAGLPMWNSAFMQMNFQALLRALDQG